MKDAVLHENKTKRLKLEITRLRGVLLMTVREWDVNGDFESYPLITGWKSDIAREPCTRATQKIIKDFIEKHTPKAKEVAAARWKVLETEHANSEA